MLMFVLESESESQTALERRINVLVSFLTLLTTEAVVVLTHN